MMLTAPDPREAEPCPGPEVCLWGCDKHTRDALAKSITAINYAILNPDVTAGDIADAGRTIADLVIQHGQAMRRQTILDAKRVVLAVKDEPWDGGGPNVALSKVAWCLDEWLRADEGAAL
jgi:hypothetical protein